MVLGEAEHPVLYPVSGGLLLVRRRKPCTMTPLELVQSKRAHAARLANQRGAAGEQSALSGMKHWLPRPSGVGLKTLLNELCRTGIIIKGTSFDAVHVPGASSLDFSDEQAVRDALPTMSFIEIKTATQERVKPGFAGFFFAITEGEMAAADVLGTRHKVALYNKQTDELLLTSVPEILARAKSSTWQLSVQL